MKDDLPVSGVVRVKPFRLFASVEKEVQVSFGRQNLAKWIWFQVLEVDLAEEIQEPLVIRRPRHSPREVRRSA